jgi:hypothetical protein
MRFYVLLTEDASRDLEDIVPTLPSAMPLENPTRFLAGQSEPRFLSKNSQR